MMSLAIVDAMVAAVAAGVGVAVAHNMSDSRSAAQRVRRAQGCRWRRRQEAGRASGRRGGPATDGLMERRGRERARGSGRGSRGGKRKRERRKRGWRSVVAGRGWRAWSANAGC